MYIEPLPRELCHAQHMLTLFYFRVDHVFRYLAQEWLAESGHKREVDGLVVKH